MADSMEEEMTEERERLQLDLTCPVCQSIFDDPVLLPCTHSFCRDCLRRSLRVKKCCPLCRKDFKEGQDISNRALRDTCETFLKTSNWRPNQQPASNDICKIHLKPVELYCEKDEEPLCVECVALHNTHRLWSVRDGAAICKKELGYRVQIFEKKVDSYKKTSSKISKAVDYIKQQAQQAEEQIKAEFERLRQVLITEEALRLRALGSEEEEKIAALQELNDKTTKDIAALKELTDSLKKEMGNEDLPLLRNFKELKSKARWGGEDPRLGEGCLLDMGKHVGALSFKIWKNMQAHVKYNPVVLDPNTASPWLALSADLTSVKESSERLTVPDNPERFDPCVFVLGAEGYTSGKHKWDISVGDHPKWVVGVCKESVPRKKKFTVNTSRGVWAIGLSKGVYTALTPERTELQVQQRPEVIRVKLNIDKGEVSFWDGGTAKHLVTLTHKFDERIYPIFGPGLHNTPMILASGKMAVHTS
ncbi:tripartite motif containing 35-28 [Cheilinus undulatus]|uniref:tripartite motif containing 35-28 n=1 Tax=Cheilinus undulatus TaxID=241271 RepID=UPI001BD587A6|nr:tripartite motif containing 35-28 [Cheilinus undulatus]XP_041649622.1 tripartite motif containing 35-28 [Cheilinus undulatus]XP_041649623.1 tripartite motif containing 35-28 [Cheilinus undulatus]